VDVGKGVFRSAPNGLRYEGCFYSLSLPKPCFAYDYVWHTLDPRIVGKRALDTFLARKRVQNRSPEQARTTDPTGLTDSEPSASGRSLTLLGVEGGSLDQSGNLTGRALPEPEGFANCREFLLSEIRQAEAGNMLVPHGTRIENGH